jgi:hypothetical protein
MTTRKIVVASLLVVVAAVGLWVVRWLMVPADVASPENVKKQWASIYQHLEALDATAQQICSAERAVASANSASQAEEATQRRSQLMAYEQNYARIQGEYNAKLRNAFEAKHVKPSDVPDKAPALADVKTRVCAP